MAMSVPQRIAAAVLAVSLLSGCSSVQEGTPSMSPVNGNEYTGPALSTDKPTEATALVPGVELSIGQGTRTVTCTMGWIIRGSDTSSFLTTAGQCGTPGNGMPVQFRYVEKGKSAVMDGTQDLTVADVLETTFREPFNPDNPNIALLTWRQEGTDTVPVSALPGDRVRSEPYTVGDAGAWAIAHQGQKVCWITESSHLDEASGMYRCGQVHIGVGSKISLIRKDRDVLQPQHAGAPVFWQDESGKYRPLGIATEDRKGYVVVDTLDGVLDKLNEQGDVRFELLLSTPKPTP